MAGTPQIPAALKKAQKLANLMDTAFRIPVIGYRIGLDGVLGLIPGIGDVITVAIAGRIVYLGKQLGVPAPVRKKMIRNIAMDFGLGLIPLAGDLADFFFKANKANVKLMEKWWLENHANDVHSASQAQLKQWAANAD